MTTKELIALIAEDAQITKKQAETLMSATAQTLVQALNDNKTVQLKNLGSLEIKQRQPRNVTNPKTGEKTRTQQKRVVTFRPNRQLKEKLK
jgi:nucleoid DNA-binding protein